MTGQTKIGSKSPNDGKNIEDIYVAQIGVTGAPPWSQAWGWGSQASAWWLGGVLESAPTGDSVILRGDFNTHVGSNSVTWRGVIGRNGLPDLN